METEGEDWSTKTIGGLGTYGRNNLYLFQPSVKNTGSVFLTRYRNIAGSETKYQKGTHYTMIPISGTVLPEQLGGFAIDENFYARGDGKLFQFRRSSNAGTALDFREVPLK